MTRKKKPGKKVQVRGGKHPQAEGDVSGAKRPTARPHDRTTTHCIVWGFGLLDIEGAWSWLSVSATDDHHREVLRKLGQIEKSTWGEAIGSGSAGAIKAIPVENLCRDAQERLIELQQDDLDQVWEIRLSGVKRVWGARDGAVFRLLWWDPKHQVCPSHTRNT